MSDGQIAEIVLKLEQLQRDRYYGTVTLVFEGGFVDRYEMKQTIKLARRDPPKR